MWYVWYVWHVVYMDGLPVPSKKNYTFWYEWYVVCVSPMKKRYLLVCVTLGMGGSLLFCPELPADTKGNIHM